MDAEYSDDVELSIRTSGVFRRPGRLRAPCSIATPALHILLSSSRSSNWKVRQSLPKRTSRASHNRNLSTPKVLNFGTDSDTVSTSLKPPKTTPHNLGTSDSGTLSPSKNTPRVSGIVPVSSKLRCHRQTAAARALSHLVSVTEAANEGEQCES